MNPAEDNDEELEFLEESDTAAVMRYVIEGIPLDPVIRRRVNKRAQRITEKIFRLHGYIDVDKLLREARDEG
jgi:hypothetical protein